MLVVALTVATCGPPMLITVAPRQGLAVAAQNMPALMTSTAITEWSTNQALKMSPAHEQQRDGAHALPGHALIAGAAQHGV